MLLLLLRFFFFIFLVGISNAHVTKWHVYVLCAFRGSTFIWVWRWRCKKINNIKCDKMWITSVCKMLRTQGTLVKPINILSSVVHFSAANWAYIFFVWSEEIALGLFVWAHFVTVKSYIMHFYGRRFLTPSSSWKIKMRR